MPRRPALLLLLALLAAALPAALPAASSARDGARPSAAFVGRLLENLGDADPQVRDAARRSLLTLDVEDVPLLEQAVRDAPAAAASPAAALVLRDTLRHLYLRRAKQTYHRLEDAGEAGIDDPSAGHAFLGIGLPPDANFADPYGGLEPERPGVTVVRTLPGFNAYETLEAGDVLVGLDVGGREYPLAGRSSLIGLLGAMRPGDPVTFRLVRAGAVLRLPFRLDRFVNTQGDAAWPPLAAGAEREAEQTWRTRFAPLFNPVATAATTRPTDG